MFDHMIAELSRDRPQYFAVTAPHFFGVGLPNVSVSPEIIQWGVGLALKASPKATIDITRAFTETDFRPDMQAFTVPTLIIHGSKDPIVPFEVSGKKTAAAIPGCRLKVYKDASHGLFITHKERLNADVLEFVCARSDPFALRLPVK